MKTVQQKSGNRQLGGVVGGALLKAAREVQAYARRVELREPTVSKPFYAASCWLKTAAANRRCTVSARKKRVNIKREPPLDKTPVTLPKHQIDALDRLLDRAQDTVMLTLERIPRLRGLWGPTAAISVHEDLRTVRNILAKAGGAS